MKNRKGFTLIEIMAVIAVLAVVTLVTAPTITRMYKESSDEEYSKYLDTLILATETYITSNIDRYPELKIAGSSIVVSVGTLRNEGYVKKELINPKTKSNTLNSDGLKVTVKSDLSYEYTFVNNV